MQSLEGKGRYAVWKRTSSPTSIRTIRKDITKYLSELTKEGVDIQASVAQNHPNWLKEGVDYLTKEDQGKLKAFGFIRDDIIKLRGKFPHRMENNDLVDASMDAWQARLKKKNIKRVAHKYVLSLSPQLCEVLMQTKHSADELLTNSVREVMRRYQEKYYPGEKLGYLVGIHHDKAHLHAHVMLFPTTEKGKLLRVTDESKKRGGRRPFEFMRKTAEKDVERFYQKEIKYPYKATQRDTQRYTQPRILAFVSTLRASQSAKDKNLPADTHGVLMYQERERLLHGSDANLRAGLKEGYAQADRTYKSLQHYHSKDDTALARFELNLKSKTTNVKQQLDACYKEVNAIKVGSQLTAQARRSLYEDVSNWSHFRFNYAHITQGGYNMRDHEVAEWASKRLSQSDPLGKLMHDWVEDKRARNAEVDLPKEMLSLMASGDNPLAARKFTEKDAYARKCISKGNESIKDNSLNMIATYLRQHAVHSMRSQRDFVKDFLKAEIKTHSSEIEEMKQRRTEISQRVKILRAQLQSCQLEGDLAKGVRSKRRPAFLEEFKHWESFNLPIPTQALDVIRKTAESSGSDKISGTTFNTRIQDTLRSLRNQRMQGDAPTIVGQFKVSQDASNPQDRLQGGRARISDNETNTPNAQKFLGTRRDGLPRVESGNAGSAEERRIHVRERYMSQDEDGVLGR
jgi:hypothetical protein